MFISLHNHSDHSIHDGFQTVEKMIEFVKNHGQTAVALTDHGTMSGCGEGFRFAKKQGIKFIAGCEHYLAPDVGIKDKTTQHIILLAMNDIGYRNLNIITSIAHSEDNYYFKPRIDLDLLRKYNEGIICTTACIAGCQDKVPELYDIFGDRLYIEIHTNQMEKQKEANKKWIAIAEKYGIPYYAAVDAHYTNKEDGMFQRKWTGYLYEDDDNIRYDHNLKKWFDINSKEVRPYEVQDDYYMHTEEEVREALSYLPEEVVEKAIANTSAVADRCTFEINYNENHYPKSPYESPRDEVRMRVWSGMKVKGLQKDQEHIDQVRHELDVLGKVNYFDYFLIVGDMLNYCHANNIRTGVGRGSVVGCDVAYLMGITKIDPIKQGLIFERFAHTERVTPPDIDTDIPRSRRQDVIQYLKKTYGNVFQVVTFGKMQNRGSIRRACDAFHLDATTKDTLSKLETVENLESADLENICGFTQRQKISFINTVKQFNGKIQNYGTHASAVVVMTTDPYNFCAVERFNGSKGIQYNLNYDFHDLESMGLLKLDILGLETLDIIDNVLENITKEDVPDMDNLPEDGLTYSLLNSGKKCGLFQLDGNAVGGIMKQIKPSQLSDITAIVALGRPGPMQSGMSDRYIKNRGEFLKNGTICSENEVLHDAFADTYDTVVYQEQVMKLCQIVWGMTLGEADMIRRAIARKDKELMEELIRDLSARPNKVGFSAEQIRILLDNLEKQSGYLFNKSHAAAYAYTAYQTAYLKAHWTKEFYCALLNSEVIDQDKSVEILAEVKSRFRVESPNILESEYKWSIKGNAIVAGLSYIKGVGSSTFLKPHTDDINGFREFISLNPDLSKTVVSGLAKAGAFHIDPMWAIDYADAKKKAVRREKECKEKILYYINRKKQKSVEEWRRKLQEIPELPKPEDYRTPIDKIREMQKESLGFSGVDLFGQYDKTLIRGNNVMVFIDKIDSFNDRNGNPMWKLTGQKTGGQIECIFWKPKDNIIDKLKTMQEKTVWIIRMGKMNSDGKSCFCYDLIPAKKLA